MSDTVVCPHCKGKGRCTCERCMAFRDGIPGQDFRDEPDTGRQNEGDCYICNGLGKVLPDGQAIEV